MNADEFRKAIQDRIQCDDDWDYGIEQCWKKEIAILTENIPSTIAFLKNECTADEFSWISEVFEDVIEVAPSKELVQAYKNLMRKFPEECEQYNIAGSVECAEAILKWEDKHGKKN